MLEPIKIQPQTSSFDFDKIYKETYIDTTKEIKLPPIAMGIGHHFYKGNIYLNPTFTYGEMSAIIAPQKTKKTFFKSALIASYIGGRSDAYFPNMKSMNNNKMVFDFDTEQGDFYAQTVTKRINEMVGNVYNKFFSFGLKKITEEERLQFIDTIIEKHKGDIGWVCIDGIADLCYDTNNITKSKEVIEKLMKWTSYGIHINTVIHKTFEKEKGTGHLGSYVQKKCETTIFLKSTDEDNNNAPVLVIQKDARGVPFEKFWFDIDEYNSLPKLCEEPSF